MIRIFYFLVLSSLLVSCDSKLQLTSETVVESLVQQELIRIDINFCLNRVPVDYFDDGEPMNDAIEISCYMDLNNYSANDIVLDRSMFIDYTNYHIVSVDSGGQVPCASPLPHVYTSDPFLLAAGDTERFWVRYGVYDCFHYTRTKDGAVYEGEGKYRFFHELAPNDSCIFSISRDGTISQIMSPR